MDRKTELLIVSALREATLRWETRSKVFNKYSKDVQEGFYKNGKPKFKKHYQCCGCKSWFRDKKSLELDHIVEIGSKKDVSWDVYIDRMFCAEENLQPLCSPCHQSKTTANATLRFTRKTKV